MQPVQSAIESLQAKGLCPRLHVDVTHADAVCPDFVREQIAMWRAVNDDGTLTYSFVESLKFTYPYYGLRLLGGVLFLGGMLIMAYNVWKTVSRKEIVPVPVRQPA